MAQHCLWCAKTTNLHEATKIHKNRYDPPVLVCSDACEQQVLNFGQYVRSHIGQFLWGVVCSLVIGIALNITSIAIKNHLLERFGVLVMLAGIGTTILAYPFVTPQTIGFLGIRRGIVLGRIIGGVMIALGVAVSLFAF